MIEIPYELELALKAIVDSQTMSDYENQELIFILYKYPGLTWEEILEKATLKSLDETSLRECQSGLWVIGYIQKEGDDLKKTYELSLFGKRLLEAMMSVFTVSTKQSQEVEK